MGEVLDFVLYMFSFCFVVLCYDIGLCIMIDVSASMLYLLTFFVCCRVLARVVVPFMLYKQICYTC